MCHKTKNWGCIGAFSFLALLLCGCESLGAWNERSRTEQASAPTNITAERLDNVPGVLKVPQFPIPQDRDLKIMTSKLSGGAVEIFDLDSPASRPPPSAGGPPAYAGIPMATDPRVTVYPLDGAPMGPAAMANTYPPPVWPNVSLPLGHSTAASPNMTPIPSLAGLAPGDVPRPEVSPSVSRIYFPFGSARLNDQSYQALAAVANTAKFAMVDRVRVEGYASTRTQVSDPVKAKILNLKESMNRAQSVSQTLIQNGVPAEKIKTIAWGDTRPEGAPEPAQRRVDIITAAIPE